tara:strand:+ start:4326 stop:5351 length:1026 start_codon:yes stop_codon:yes gene_type:complete
MSSEILIKDNRVKFKNTTFSNFKKSEVSKKLLKSIYYNKLEESFFWTCEMLCSNMLLELWETFFILMSKYIHIDNPKLPIYISAKYEEFKNIIAENDNIEILRNNSDIRIIFCTITTILCESSKNTTLDNLQYKFEFKIENMYNNLKAPNVDYIKLVYTETDPKEYLIPFNEFIYHLTETKEKVNIMYWLNWIIEYDILCRKKKKNIFCTSREFYTNPKEHLERNIIWIIWDIILKISEKNLTKDNYQLIFTILQLFKVRYTLSTNKKRISMIYHCIEIYFMNRNINFKINILNNKTLITNLSKNINIIMEEIKKYEKYEKAPTTTGDKKIDVYKNIYMNL